MAPVIILEERHVDAVPFSGVDKIIVPERLFGFSDNEQYAASPEMGNRGIDGLPEILDGDHVIDAVRNDNGIEPAVQPDRPHIAVKVFDVGICCTRPCEHSRADIDTGHGKILPEDPVVAPAATPEMQQRAGGFHPLLFQQADVTPDFFLVLFRAGKVVINPCELIECYPARCHSVLHARPAFALHRARISTREIIPGSTKTDWYRSQTSC